VGRGHRPHGGRKWSRRAVSVPSVVIALGALAVLSPLLVIVAGAADLVTGPRRRRHLRLLAMVGATLVIEVVGLLGSLALWLACGFGLGVRRPASQHRNFALQSWWVGALMGAARRTLGLRVEVDPPEPTAAIGGTIVLARHTSIGDALLPAYLFGTRLGLAPRYTLKHDLVWDPCIDIVGHRLPHHFIDREASDSAQLDAIRALSTGLDPRSVAVIFPEGTFFTPARRDRAVARLRAGDRHELAERAAGFRSLLPPRPAGTIALLDGAPDADVVIMGHIGFERFSSLGRIYRNVPFRDPVRVWFHRLDRSDVPDDREARITWLYDQWTALDAEVTEHQALPSPP
jgi:1-acyl-sn-glycerol-3-phosphate acyltransferase